MREGDLKLQSTLQNSSIETYDVETQTEQSMESDLLPQNIQPPSLLENTQNPRRKGSVPTSRKMPPFVFKKLLEKSKAPLVKKRTSLSKSAYV